MAYKYSECTRFTDTLDAPHISYEYGFNQHTRHIYITIIDTVFVFNADEGDFVEIHNK